jgi:hypothetical protein
MNEKNLVTVDISLIKMVSDMLDEQERFFQLTAKAKKSGIPQLWNDRKESLANCKALEAEVKKHCKNILEGFGMSADQALKEIKEQLGINI